MIIFEFRDSSWTSFTSLSCSLIVRKFRLWNNDAIFLVRSFVIWFWNSDIMSHQKLHIYVSFLQFHILFWIHGVSQSRSTLSTFWILDTLMIIVFIPLLLSYFGSCADPKFWSYWIFVVCHISHQLKFSRYIFFIIFMITYLFFQLICFCLVKL